MPPDRPLTRYGRVDGSKLLCRLARTAADKSTPPCVIYSLGSNGDYQFEEAMLANTTCDVHTFDCTHKGHSIHPSRHTYHQWCVGQQGGQTRPWANITAELGHSEVQLLNMDIEGHEYPVLSSFQPSNNLPKEMAVELHLGRAVPGEPKNSSDLALVFLHLAQLGYAAYSQEVSMLAPGCCSGFSFMRVSQGPL